MSRGSFTEGETVYVTIDTEALRFVSGDYRELVIINPHLELTYVKREGAMAVVTYRGDSFLLHSSTLTYG